MGRYDALTQIEEKQEKKTPARAIPADTSTPPIVPKPTKQLKEEPEKSKMLSIKQDSLQASNLASALALNATTIESIRKIVKNPGKEDVLYVRLSKEEKDRIADVSYTYKRQGIKTSDNELVRVAINTLLEDYKVNGEKSILAIILASLHA